MILLILVFFATVPLLVFISPSKKLNNKTKPNVSNPKPIFFEPPRERSTESQMIEPSMERENGTSVLTSARAVVSPPPMVVSPPPMVNSPRQALVERLKDYGQEDIFALWDELSPDEKDFLVRDIEV